MKSIEFQENILGALYPVQKNNLCSFTYMCFIIFAKFVK